jgi:hypothetical protein
VLESDKKWSSQLVNSLQIVVFNIKLLILVTLTIALRALVNKTLKSIIVSEKVIPKSCIPFPYMIDIKGIKGINIMIKYFKTLIMKNI